VHSIPRGVQDPLARSRNMRQVAQTLDELDVPDLPVWDTELNYGLAGPGDIPKTEITGDQLRRCVDGADHAGFAAVRCGSHVLVHLDTGAVRPAGDAIDQSLGCGCGTAGDRFLGLPVVSGAGARWMGW
jgi:hypothetical protein